MIPRFRALALVSCLSVAAAAPVPARANVGIDVDAGTLSALVETMIPPKLSFDMGGSGVVTLRIEDFRVTGFDPASGNGGHILTALRLVVPELGLAVPVRPRMSLRLGEKDGRSICHLVFEEVLLPIPLGAPLNIAAALPRIPVPADEVSAIETPRGKASVRTRLLEARVGSDRLRLVFDLAVSPAAAAPPRAAR